MEIYNIEQFIDDNETYKFVTDLDNSSNFKKENVKIGTGIDLKNFIKSSYYGQLFKINKFNKQENKFGYWYLYYCRKDGYIVKGNIKNMVDYNCYCVSKIKQLEENNIDSVDYESMVSHKLFIQDCINQSKNKKNKFGENGCYSLNELVNNYFNVCNKICMWKSENKQQTNEYIEKCKQLLNNKVFSDENRKAFDDYIKRAKYIENVEF